MRCGGARGRSAGAPIDAAQASREAPRLMKTTSWLTDAREGDPLIGIEERWTVGRCVRRVDGAVLTSP
jgi:hypothetical protein